MSNNDIIKLKKWVILVVKTILVGITECVFWIVLNIFLHILTILIISKRIFYNIVISCCLFLAYIFGQIFHWAFWKPQTWVEEKPPWEFIALWSTSQCGSLMSGLLGLGWAGLWGKLRAYRKSSPPQLKELWVGKIGPLVKWVSQVTPSVLNCLIGAEKRREL